MNELKKREDSPFGNAVAGFALAIILVVVGAGWKALFPDCPKTEQQRPTSYVTTSWQVGQSGPESCGGLISCVFNSFSNAFNSFSNAVNGAITSTANAASNLFVSATGGTYQPNYYPSSLPLDQQTGEYPVAQGPCGGQSTCDGSRVNAGTNPDGTGGGASGGAGHPAPNTPQKPRTGGRP